MNQISRTIEYALLKADELTPAEIGTATGYAANEVQAGLKVLVEAKLAHKAGKAWLDQSNREVWASMLTAARKGE